MGVSGAGAKAESSEPGVFDLTRQSGIASDNILAHSVSCGRHPTSVPPVAKIDSDHERHVSTPVSPPMPASGGPQRRTVFTIAEVFRESGIAGSLGAEAPDHRFSHHRLGTIK